MRKKTSARNKWYSIRWFNCGFLHVKKFRIIGHSCTGISRRLVYYGGREAISVSIPNIIGELVHYDTNGNCIAYSKRERPWKTTHYDRRGNYLGKSFVFLRIFIVHYGFPVFSIATASRRNLPKYKWIPYLVYNVILPSELVQSIIRFIGRMLELCAHKKEH